MATKTITARVTLHLMGKGFKPFSLDKDTNLPNAGAYKITEVAPGSPATIDAEEADSLIARGFADEYIAPSAVQAPEPVAPVEPVVPAATKPAKAA